jgi:hypothetical protein
MSTIFASFLLALAVNAKVLPRELEVRTSARDPASIVSISTDGSPAPIINPTTFTNFPDSASTGFPSPNLSSQGFFGTVTIGIPSQANPTTTTVSACTQADGEVIDSIVVVGVPTGTFSPGITRTIVVPPQADPTTVTYYDTYPSNDTEVVIIEPLPGDCGPFITPTGAAPNPSGTDTSTAPSNTAAACPTKGCSGAVLRTADTIINAINQVTQLSFALQAAAKNIGKPFAPRNDATADAQLFGSPIADVALGLSRITLTVQTALPSFITFPPFPPSCSADTIVLAWLEFARVHQELLAILIGRSGLLETGPFRRDAPAEGVLGERGAQGFIGRPVAVALRGIEGVVDTLAVGIVDLVPGKSACSQARSAELKASIKRAQTSYEG